MEMRWQTKVIENGGKSFKSMYIYLSGVSGVEKRVKCILRICCSVYLGNVDPEKSNIKLIHGQFTVHILSTLE